MKPKTSPKYTSSSIQTDQPKKHPYLVVGLVILILGILVITMQFGGYITASLINAVTR